MVIVSPASDGGQLDPYLVGDGSPEQLEEAPGREGMFVGLMLPLVEEGPNGRHCSGRLFFHQPMS